MTRRRIDWRGVALMGGLAVLACGDEPAETTTTGAAMGATEKTEAAPRSDALNSAPVIESVSVEPRTARPGETIRALVEASDPDGDDLELHYEWRLDGRVDSQATERFHVTSAAKRSRIQVTVVASDGSEQSQPVTATARVGNLPPILQGVVIEPLGQVTAGRDVIASPRATDPDGDDVSFRYRWDVNGSTVDETGPVLSSSHYERGDSIRVIVTATDGQDDSDALRSDPIPVVNSPPKITSQPGAIGDDGVFRYTIEAEDPDGDRGFRYRLTEGPPGMDLDTVSGTLTWTPREDQAGRHNVKIEVADLKGARAQQSFVVLIEFQEPEAPAAPAS